MAELELGIALFPTPAMIKEIIPKMKKMEFQMLLVGEKIVFKKLEPKGFDVIETLVEIEQGDNDQELNGFEEDEWRATMKLCVHGKTSERDVQKVLKKVKLDITKYEVLTSSKDSDVKVEISFQPYDVDLEIVESPFLDMFWNKHMGKVITDGVCYSNSKVPDSLHDSLRKNIDKLAEEPEIEYHPGSNDVVRDLMQADLHCYVEGTTKVKTEDSKPPKKKLKKNQEEPKEFDFWERKYEKAKFQWLPTPFSIAKSGKCSIQDYINNLDREMFSELYGDLESLFEVFLPYFEEVWSYGKTMKFWNTETYEGFNNYPKKTAFKFKKPNVRFKNQDVQVITKIVEYTLQPGQSYEGVWEVAGFSNENIVMTGMYFIDRDEEIEAADLQFKRGFSEDERLLFYTNAGQSRPTVVDHFAFNGFLPLGRFPTDAGNLIVFPNCHFNKMAKFVNQSTTESASMRVLVFYVINPDEKIISTKEVTPQQQGGKIGAKLAMKNRLTQRTKYIKEKLNANGLDLFF